MFYARLQIWRSEAFPPPLPLTPSPRPSLASPGDLYFGLIGGPHVDIIMLHVDINKSHVNIIMLHVACAAQLRQPIENSLVLCHLKTLRLYTGFFEIELNHYLTNVARVKSTYWGRPILFINWSHDVTVTWYS